MICIFKKKPIVTIIVIFYNNKREAKRTLFSLTSKYQKINCNKYQVLAVDNNSTDPLNKEYVESFGPNFKYLYYKNDTPSPCKAINYSVSISKTPYVVICIDGARILSPGILKFMLDAKEIGINPFIYTLGMHIGNKIQNILVEEGYNQTTEDILFEKVDWMKNGYLLFNISSVALSSKNGFFSNISESNCFLIKKNDFIETGGYNEKFISKGGGLVNLDFFNTISKSNKFQSIMLLGEATFHQFHNGIATNTPLKNHPWPDMEEEYYKITGKVFESFYKKPIYYGWLSPIYHSHIVNIKD